MQAKTLIDRATVILQDESNVRWPRTELLNWLNDAQREIVLQRPDALSENSAMALAAGTKQTLPAQAIQLVDVIRNVNGRAIRPVDRAIMDAQQPDWHQHTQSNAIKHYMFDARNPRNFYVYPPAAASTQIEVVYSTAPSDCTNETANTALNDIYGNALLDYMLYRAYAKDADYAGNAQRAASHYQQFANSLGIKTRTDLAVQPRNAGTAQATA